MIGRIAGDVDDHVLNYYMVYHSSRQCEAVNAAHAEIGILFGGGLLMMLQALRSAPSKHMALAIDPLDGYYGQNLDPVTGLPISYENVAQNIQRLGFEIRTACAWSDCAANPRKHWQRPAGSPWPPSGSTATIPTRGEAGLAELLAAGDARRVRAVRQLS